MMTEHERQHMYTSGPCVSSERPAPGHIQCVPVSVQSAMFVWINTEKCLMHYVTLCGARPSCRPYDLSTYAWSGAVWYEGSHTQKRLDAWPHHVRTPPVACPPSRSKYSRSPRGPSDETSGA